MSGKVVKKRVVTYILFVFVVIVLCLGASGYRVKRKGIKGMKEAMYYAKLEGKRVKCLLCPHRCVISTGMRGFCGARENIDGILYSIVYGKPVAIHIDPVEKEPQHHFLPGSEILCIATIGCNIRCDFCHNWHISHSKFEEVSYYNASPEEIIKLALKNKIPTISYTYVEPTVFYEYMLEISRLAKENNLRVLVHSNGMINEEPLRELIKYVDAFTIDFKSIRPEFYKTVAHGDLDTLFKTLKIIVENKKHLEIVNLLITDVNDSPDDIRRLCKWVKDNLGADIPLHFSRFFPNNKRLNTIPTPIEKIETAYKIAKEVGMKYITIGNVPGHKYNSTFCPNCEKRIIHRVHFTVLSNNIVNGKCKFCGYAIYGVWN